MQGKALQLTLVKALYLPILQRVWEERQKTWAAVLPTAARYVVNQHFNSRKVSDYLAEETDRISLPGAEPYFLQGNSDVAFLALHGWSATAESVRFIAKGLNEAGHAVLAPTLPGHGASSTDMLGVGPVEWNDAARAACTVLRKSFKWVIVVGVSMGGALAIQLAAVSPDLVDGLVTINAPIFMESSAFAREIVSQPACGYLAGWDVPAFFGNAVPEISYSLRYKKSGADLYSMCALARDLLPLIQCPMLVAQSVLDQIVPKSCADEIMRRSGASIKEVLWLERSYHASQLEEDQGLIVAAAIKLAGQLSDP